MVADDPVTDRKSQAGPLARRLRREERLEEILDRLGRHPAAVVGKTQSHQIRLAHKLDVQPTTLAGRFQRVGNQVQNHLLDLGTVDLQRTRTGGGKRDRAISEPAHVTHQRQHLVDQIDQVVRCPGGVLAAREIEQAGGDFLATKRLAANHLGVLTNHRLLIRSRLAQQRLEPLLQTLTGHRNRRQRVIDLMSDPRGQEPDTRQAFRANQLTRAVADLAVEVVADVAETIGHLIERLGQLGHLVTSRQLDPVVQVPLGNPTCSLVQGPNRLKDPAIPGVDKGHEQQHRGDGRSDQPTSPRSQRSLRLTQSAPQTRSRIRQRTGRPQHPRHLHSQPAPLLSLDSTGHGQDLADLGQLPVQLSQQLPRDAATRSVLGRSLEPAPAQTVFRERLGRSSVTIDQVRARDRCLLVQQRSGQHREFRLEPLAVRSLEDTEAQLADRLAVRPQPAQAADRQRGHHHQHQRKSDDQLAPNRSGQDHRDLHVHRRRAALTGESIIRLEPTTRG